MFTHHQSMASSSGESIYSSATSNLNVECSEKENISSQSSRTTVCAGEFTEDTLTDVTEDTLTDFGYRKDTRNSVSSLGRNIPYNQSNNSNDQQVSDFLCHLWEKNVLCDVNLQCSDVRLRAHKVVLAANSERLERAFKKRNGNGEEPILDVRKHDSWDVQQILRFLYKSEIELTAANVESVLLCSVRLQLYSVLQTCLLHLSRCDVTNAMKYYTICANSKVTSLTSQIWQFICANFEKVSLSDDFLQSDIVIVLALLNEDSLSVTSEVSVYEAGMRWLKYDARRSPLTSSVLDTVRLTLLHPDDIVTKIEKNEYFKNQPDFHSRLYEAMRYHGLDGVKSPLARKYAGKPRMKVGPIKIVPVTPSAELLIQNTKEEDSSTISLKEAKVKTEECLMKNSVTLMEDKLLRSEKIQIPAPAVFTQNSRRKKSYQNQQTVATKLKDFERKESPISENIFNNKEKNFTTNANGSQTELPLEDTVSVESQKPVSVIDESETDCSSREDSSEVFLEDPTPDESYKVTCMGWDNALNKSSKMFDFTPKGAEKDKGDSEDTEDDSYETTDTDTDTTIEDIFLDGKSGDGKITAYGTGGRRRMKNTADPTITDAKKKSIFVIGGMDITNPNGAPIMALIEEQQQWTTVPHLPENTCGYAAVVLNGDIIITGGEMSQNGAKGTATSKVFKYRNSSKKWSQLAPMLRCRALHNAVAHDDKIYVIGGMDEKGRYLDSVEEYNAKENTWKVAFQMPYAAIGVAVTVLNNKLYIIGGIVRCGHCGPFLRDVVRYNFQTARWEFQTKLDYPICNASAVRVQDSLYLVGGMTDGKGSLDSILKYDEAKDEWVEEDRMSSPRLDASVIAVGDKIIIVGGMSKFGDKCPRGIEIYDTVRRCWGNKNSPDFPCILLGSSVCLLTDA